MAHSGDGDVSQLPGSRHSELRIKQIHDSLEQLEADLWPEIESGKIDLSKEPRGLVMSLRESALFPPRTMAGVEGLEPPTCWFEARRSIR